MSLKNKLTIAVLTLSLVSVSAWAEMADNAGSGRENRKQKMFEEQDKNGDGKISLEEFKAHSEVIFAKKDKNGDGYLTQDEMRHPKKMKDGEAKSSSEGNDAPPPPPEGSEGAPDAAE